MFYFILYKISQKVSFSIILIWVNMTIVCASWQFTFWNDKLLILLTHMFFVMCRNPLTWILGPSPACRPIWNKYRNSFKNLGAEKKGRFCNNSEIDALNSKRLSVENKAKLSQMETNCTSSAVLFICNFQLREFRFVLYR